jgi:outer membrane protein assembly factor BamB
VRSLGLFRQLSRNKPRRSAVVGVAAAIVLLTTTAATAEDWPMFHHDATHTGVSAEVAIDSTNAATLGPNWEANLGSASYVSPAVAFNQQLQRTLVYVGTQGGQFRAYDAANGQPVWSFKAGSHIQSSPAVAGNVVYVGGSNHYLFALNAATGALLCRFNTGGVISSSPVVADVDGTGDVVYFGDNGLTGSDDGGAEWAINGVDPNPAANCSLKWAFHGFGVPPGSATLAGSWSPPAIARDTLGRNLLVFGSSSPDSAVYAVNALNGNLVWRFQPKLEFDSDVGTGPTISPPGVNGFADGVVYVAGKNKIMYALNLRTGAQIWAFNVKNDSPEATKSTRSTAALLGRTLYFGYGGGVYSLDAVTGTRNWKTTTGEVVSSPAIGGGATTKVVLFGDMNGFVRALRLSTGESLWSYRTGNFIYGSPALSAGKLFIAGADGFLYAFAPGGAPSGSPTTTIVSPSNNASVANPSGNLTISGAAGDDVGVSSVLVAVKDKNASRWWNGSTRSWTSTFVQNAATLSAPGSMSTNWSFAFPAPTVGGSFLAQAEAVDGDGQHDSTPALVNFTITSLTNPPETRIVSPTQDEVFAFPVDGSGNIQHIHFPISIQGSASDAAGTPAGVSYVWVVIRNIEHDEYYCGPAGCGSASTTGWVPTWRKLKIAVANPGATSTSWTTSFPVYDHPHDYRITAWAVDADGQQDLTRAHVRICVRDPGDTTCP